MSNIVSLRAHRIRATGGDADHGSTGPAPATELWDARRQRTREALQEAVFALQVTHARTCTVIDRIDNPNSRETLQTQSAHIGALLDIVWARLGDL